MKKFLVLVILAMSFGVFINQVKADSEVTDIYVHYFRFAGDYSQWGLWAWESEPTAAEGFDVSFVTDETSVEYNFGGVVAHISIADNFPGITSMGLIVKTASWTKDVGSDRFIDIPATSVNGEAHFYLVEGDSSIGTSLDDPNGPVKNPKFKSAYFTELDTIVYKTTETVPSANIRVYEDSVELTIASIEVVDDQGTLVLSNDLDFSKVYTIEATFPSDSSVNDYTVTFDGIYDSDEFEQAFAYDGELGAIIDGSTTTFRVWAPISSAVTLNLYSTGTPEKYGGSDVPTQTYEMTAGEKGTFYYEANSNLHGTYYTYSVTNGTTTSEVVDPYAKSTGVNGLRGLVVDFSQVNPSGWTYNTRPDNMDNYTDAIIYELHVRDLTASDTWNGTEANRGKYLGLVESGTTYSNVATGFDHIVDLGVTTVQLQPFFDFGVVDETKLDDADYNTYNWGYMPLNFNTLEGSYSSNPYDGLVRISEFKQVMIGYTAADIRINMDVVYNHTGLSADSNFNLIVPGYYYRMTDTGAFSNGSGTGNETASERVMMRKFIVDSTSFWATEYNISGFRFDLMALHDIDTMEAVVDALHAIDPTIMVYGEPWTGGTSTLPPSQMAGKSNLSVMDGVAAFNDDTRDGIKGSVFQREAGGFIQDGIDDKEFDPSFISKVKYGIIGGIAYPGMSYSVWHTQPTKTINYVACHDNNTLYDKLYLTLEKNGNTDLIPELAKQAYGIVLTSQGIPFIYSGDEFLRSKPLEDGSGFDHNSYESPDSVNEMRWDLLTTEDGAAMNAYVKGLIALRKSHSSFTMSTASDIVDNLDFVYDDVNGVIAYTLKNDDSGDDFSKIMVIQNANSKNVSLKLPTGGGWVLITDEETAGSTMLDEYLGGSRISVEEHSTYILVHDPLIADYNPTPAILISVFGGLAVIAGATMIILHFKKK